MKKISKRKKEHIEVALRKESQYLKSAGFEKIRLVHNALPEMDYEEIDLSVSFLGKRLNYPIMITGMTGGYQAAKKINKNLAMVAEKHKIAFGVGSQRAMVEHPSLASTFSVRSYAPSIPIVANIGGIQLKHFSMDQIENIISILDADALAIHLNALQEIIQPEGERDFKGIERAITDVCDKLSVPVIVKETGAGISREVAFRLRKAGVEWIDVSGSGGTSWSKIEYLRSKKATPGFENWGIPTVDSVLMCRGVLPLIASGGIRNGIDGAKALSIGADLVGAAQPFLKAVVRGRLENELKVWEEQLKITAFLTGSKNVKELKRAKYVFEI